MQSKLTTLSFHGNKNCFISLPRSWTSKLPRDKILPFEISSEDGTIYTSWAGSVSGPGQHRGLDSEVVELNGLFGTKQGLKHGQEVLLTPLPSPAACTRLFVEPLSTNDWEILEMHASLIENNLLNQVRIVWAEQTIPVWVQKAICVFVKIGRIESTNPSGKCFLIGQNTEVVVSPKVRAGGHHQVSTPVKPRSVPAPSSPLTPVPPSPENSTPTQAHTETPSLPSLKPPLSGAEAANAEPRDTLQPDSEDPLHDISGFSSLDNSFNEESHEPAQDLSTNTQHGTGSGTETHPIPSSQAGDDFSLPPSSINTEDQPPPFDSLKDSDTSDDPELLSFHQRVLSSIKTWWSGDEPRLSPPGGTSKEAPPAVDTVVDCDGVLRVCALPESEEPYTDPDQTPLLTSTGSWVDLASQPTNVYISLSACLRYCQCDPVTLPSCFLATLRKLDSPTTKAEQMKQNMAKRSERKLAGGEASGRETAHVLEEPTVVRVIVLDYNNQARVADQAGERAGAASMAGVSWLPDDHVMVHGLLRRQLGLEITARVRLTAFRGSPHNLTSLSLHRLFTMPSGFTNGMLETVFEVWLSKASSASCPLVVTQGVLIKCWMKEGLHGEFLLTFSHKPPSGEAPPVPYCLLDEQLLENTSLKIEEQLTDSVKPTELSRLPYHTTEQFDLAVPDTTTNQLGGSSALLSSGVEHIAMCLACTPLTGYLFDEHRGMCNGGLLICGARGTGKTALAQALCNETANKPPWPYIVTVECKTLKGKRTENIRTYLESILNELAWRQPGVLFLDDVDTIMASASGPEQEMSGEAMYFTKNAELLKELLLQEKSLNTRMAVVATCKSTGSLHPCLTSPTGHHLFQETLKIKPTTEETRQAILESVMLKKTNINMDCVKTIDLAKITQTTEGFVARDLESVVDRAIHARLTDTGRDTQERELQLTNENFTTALEDYTPAALRNVSLHKAGDLGWCDVGGLHDVRHALVQTLEWPAKYPKLFASCPLRLRSGLLLYGAPGTGKTLLAGVVAKECGLNFISIKGPELLSKYIGASEQAVRDTFARAQSAKPCILFFDEFDSLAPRRGHDNTGVTDRVVNQLLTQLDGVEGLEGVYMLAATSRPDLIDPALLRPGRLDKALHCGLPNQRERLEILRALTRSMDLSDDVDLRHIADNSESLTGADFKALLYNAQLEAVHQITDTVAETAADGADRAEDSSSTDTKHPSLVYMPNLEEGITTLPAEKHAKLLQQVEQCLGKAAGGDSAEDTRSVARVVVCQSHLVNALRKLSPSVSDRERQKYQRIYQHFVASRGGNFSDGVQTVGKRATLA